MNDTETHVASKEHRGVGGLLRAVAPYFSSYKAAVVLILFCMLVELGYASALPLMFKMLIDQAIVPHNVTALTEILAALTAGSILCTATSFVQDLAYARMGVGVMNEIRLRLFSHIQDLSMDYFARTQIGDIASRFSAGLASVERALIWSLPAVLSSLLSLVVTVVIMFSLEWRLAIISVAGVAVSFLLAKRLEPRSNDLNYRLKEESGAVAVIVQENLLTQAVVKGFDLKAREIQRFRARLHEMRALAARASWVGYFMARIPTVGALIIGFLTLGLGAYFVFGRQMTTGQLVAFYALFGQISSSVTYLTYSTPFLLEGAAEMERVEEILVEKPSVKDGPDAKPLPPLMREIAFEGVSFGYTADTKSLDDVSLTIPQGGERGVRGSERIRQEHHPESRQSLLRPTGGHGQVRREGHTRGDVWRSEEAARDRLPRQCPLRHEHP